MKTSNVSLQISFLGKTFPTSRALMFYNALVSKLNVMPQKTLPFENLVAKFASLHDPLVNVIGVILEPRIVAK